MIKLIHGVAIKDIARKDRELIDELVRLKILKNKKNVLKLDAKCRVGKIDISKNGTGFLETLGVKKQKDLVIEPKNLKGANRRDLVIAKRIFSKKGRPSAKVVYILEKEFSYSVVYLSKVNERIVGINVKSEIAIELTATQKSLKALPLNTILKIDNTNGAISEVLGVLDDPSVDEKISLALFNKTEFFTKEAEAEATSYGNFVDKSMYPDRVNLIHLPFCTIDPNDAKDYDDAIYFDIEKRELYVAIADVSEYVTINSNIDKEAYQRCFSIYFPHKSIPMLPRKLSENICSLKPNEDRLAFIFKITLDENLNVTKEELFDGIINSKKRFTYGRVDEFLAGKFDNLEDIEKEILKFLIPLYEITVQLKKRRLKKGYDFASDEVRMILDKKFKLTDAKIEEETPSHGLIEDCMLLANRAAAKKFDLGIFRTHEEPDNEKIEDLIDKLSMIGIFVNEEVSSLHRLVELIQADAREKNLSKYVDKLIIQAQKRASYTYNNIGHFGLGFKHYTHFTSPIRRYSDLTLHRLLKAIIRRDNRLEEFLLRNMESVTLKVSDLEREAAKVEWDFLDRVFARWAKENIGKIVKAVVTEIDRTPIAKIEGELTSGARVFLIHDKDEVELFDHINIEITDSNIATAKIYGNVIENRGLDI